MTTFDTNLAISNQLAAVARATTAARNTAATACAAISDLQASCTTRTETLAPAVRVNAITALLTDVTDQVATAQAAVVTLKNLLGV